MRSERQGAVGIIRLIDEKRRNILTFEFREQFQEAFYGFAADPDVRSIVILGEGPAFCAGGDFQMMKTESDAWTAHQRLSRSARWLTDLIRCPKPIVVGVNGPAVGGGIGLALCGDIIYAANDRAVFTAGFGRLGLIPDVATMYTLPRAVGLSRANSFVFDNQSWTATEAEQYGLITAAVPDADLETRCVTRAAEFAAGPIEGVGMAKQLMGRSYESSLDQMLVYEDLGQSVTYQTEAVREGVDAVINRRSPDFASATNREVATQLDRTRRSNDD